MRRRIDRTKPSVWRDGKWKMRRSVSAVSMAMSENCGCVPARGSLTVVQRTEFLGLSRRSVYTAPSPATVRPMHQILVFIVEQIALAHEHWRAAIGRARALSGHIATLEDRVAQLEAEAALLRSRLCRLRPRNRPHYRPTERFAILLHAARYRISVTATARTFGVARQTIINWRNACRNGDGSIGRLPVRTLSELIDALVQQLKTEWPRWGTRRIAGVLARMAVRCSRSTVQRVLRNPRRPEPEDVAVTRHASSLLARYPNHVWMIDFTRLKRCLGPIWVGAVIDAYSRRVLAIGSVRRGPNGAFATQLLRRAITRHGAPTWLVTDKDPVLRSKWVNALLRQHGTRRRYGRIGRKGSIAIIERFWRSMKQEYVRHLFLYRSTKWLDGKLASYATWFNVHRPHQELGQGTPSDVYAGAPRLAPKIVGCGTLHVRFHDGDRRLPVLRLADAA